MRGQTLGYSGFAWIVSLINEEISFFGKSSEATLVSLFGNNKVLLPKNIGSAFDIFKDSISLFGIKNTILHLLNSLGGLTEEFKQSVMQALSDDTNTFNYGQFVTFVSQKVPVFSAILKIIESRH